MKYRLCNFSMVPTAKEIENRHPTWAPMPSRAFSHQFFSCKKSFYLVGRQGAILRLSFGQIASQLLE